MKSLLLATAALALMPCAAGATDWTVTASNSYTWERQSETFSKKPVVNAGADFSLASIPTNVWVQVGDKNSQELDISFRPEVSVGDATIGISGGGFFYPKAQPWYFGGLDVSIPLGPAALELEAFRYEGGSDYRNTMLTAALAVGDDDGPTGSLGVAHNSSIDAFSGFVRAELPLGDSGFAIGVRAYRVFKDVEDHDNTGIAFDLVKRF